ncbi:MAG TPA: nucleotide exchange factor GrpE [Lacipirellulaceae bacterium]|jgi:molecular chaperone GrpE|nr:nucleotide exchange factor GrpE [Lacipirellulaceae bacterium]
MSSKKHSHADSDDDSYSDHIDLSAAMGEMSDKSEKATADASSELATANDRLLRLQAEMQNLRNRTSREIADERKYAALPVIRDLLPVVDNIDRAIEAAEKAGEAENLLAGFRLVKQQLHSILTNHSVELIAAEDEIFDPNIHQAILQQPSADVPAGNIMMVTQRGYKMHDRVVRPAQVIVSAGPGEVGQA